jgi:hypothetical protein
MVWAEQVNDAFLEGRAAFGLTGECREAIFTGGSSGADGHRRD